MSSASIKEDRSATSTATENDAQTANTTKAKSDHDIFASPPDSPPPADSGRTPPEDSGRTPPEDNIAGEVGASSPKTDGATTAQKHVKEDSSINDRQGKQATHKKDDGSAGHRLEQRPSSPSLGSPRRDSMLRRTHTIVSCIYRGTVAIDAPRSSKEVNRVIDGLAAGKTTTSTARPIQLCVPRIPGGRINLISHDSGQMLATYRLRSIIFCCRGVNTPNFIGITMRKAKSAGGDRSSTRPSRLATTVTTVASTDAAPSVDDGADVAGKASQAEDATPPANDTNTNPSDAEPAANAFASRDDEATEASLNKQRPTSQTASQDSLASAGRPTSPAAVVHLFEFTDDDETKLALDAISTAFRIIKTQIEAGADIGKSSDIYRHTLEFGIGFSEDDAKAGRAFCPLSKEAFKFRRGHTRRLHINITQAADHGLIVQETRRIGMEDSTGKRHWMAIDETSWSQGSTYYTETMWPMQVDLLQPIPVKMTGSFALVVELGLAGLEEPLEVVKPFKVNVLASGDRFWIQGKKDSLRTVFELNLEAASARPGTVTYQVANLSERPPLARQTYLSRLNNLIQKQVQLNQTEDDDDDDVDADEEEEEELKPYMSGQGKVEQDMSDRALELWSDMLAKWPSLSRRQLISAARRGVPDRLRNQVWLHLADADDTDLIETYPFLLRQESEFESVIMWDLMRTFPAHDFFKDPQGPGQRLLYNINKAYSVYDEEIGYCQGLSFVTAVLLLHMPEEQAFATFVRIMQHYNFRELFKHGFEALNLRFYQLGRLIEDHLSDVHVHFSEIGVEVHMFASQWFLTLFSAKFSLPLAYRIMDVFLAEGVDVLFNVALALLKQGKKELLQASFEEVMSFFRIDLPRLFQTDDDAARVISTASRFKISAKKLARYEKEYLEEKAAQAASQDPMQQLKEENGRLMERTVELEAELEAMSKKLLNEQTQMQSRIDVQDDELTVLKQENEALKKKLKRVMHESSEEVKHLEEETRQVKQMYRATLEKSDSERTAFETQVKDLRAQLTKLREFSNREQTRLETEARTLRAQVAASGAADTDLSSLFQKVEDLEMELAMTKTHVAEKQSHIETLEQRLLAASTESSKRSDDGKKRSLGSWFNKHKS